MPKKKKIEENINTPDVQKVEPEVKAEEKVKEEKSEKKEKKQEKSYYFGTGRRKTATAVVKLYLPTKEIIVSGNKLERGDVYVNGIPIEKYFHGDLAKMTYTEVFRTTNTVGRFITVASTQGSGGTGQLGAVVLAIARALVSVDPKFRAILRKKGYMTRDPRAKERKKPGLMGARKQKSSPKR